ncbi:hypothetical protein Q3G72_006042 [Acer saccharum]|nr:hypothetical protein Q3G72_006042 [Acer saccharum]
MVPYFRWRNPGLRWPDLEFPVNSSLAPDLCSFWNCDTKKQNFIKASLKEAAKAQKATANNRTRKQSNKAPQQAQHTNKTESNLKGNNTSSKTQHNPTPRDRANPYKLHKTQENTGKHRGPPITTKTKDQEK